MSSKVAKKKRGMVLLNKVARGILKFLFSAIGGAIGFTVMKFVSVFIIESLGPFSLGTIYVFYAVATLLFAIIFYLLYGSLERFVIRVVNSIDNDIKKLGVFDFLVGVVGLVVGLLISALIGVLVSKIEIPLVTTIVTIFVYVIVVATSMSIFIRRKEEFRRIFDSLRNKPQNTNEAEVRNKALLQNSNISGSLKVVDTSVIIDGRILDIMGTGFIEGELIIPSFVLSELQYIADSEDAERRNRGRRGLDMLNELQVKYPDNIEVREYEKPEKMPVDLTLLQMADELGGVVLTNDYNLNKVAKVKGIKVLNINDLANAVKPVVLPGENMTVKITGIGTEEGQGVAYLNDGTMIVVEKASKLVGEVVEVSVQSVLQTSAGRLIFAKVKNDR